MKEKQQHYLWTYSNGLKQNPSPSHVLVLQELLSLLPLLHRTLQEKTGEARQGDIIPVKIHPLEETAESKY